MNGFKLQADAHRKYLEMNPDDPNRSSIERKIYLFDFLSVCNETDICELYNSSVFNEITKGYTKLALENVGIDDEHIKMVMEELRHLHDTKRADEVL